MMIRKPQIINNSKDSPLSSVVMLLLTFNPVGPLRGCYCGCSPVGGSSKQETPQFPERGCWISSLDSRPLEALINFNYNPSSFNCDKLTKTYSVSCRGVFTAADRLCNSHCCYGMWKLFPGFHLQQLNSAKAPKLLLLLLL